MFSTEIDQLQQYLDNLVDTENHNNNLSPASSIPSLVEQNDLDYAEYQDLSLSIPSLVDQNQNDLSMLSTTDPQVNESVSDQRSDNYLNEILLSDQQVQLPVPDSLPDHQPESRKEASNDLAESNLSKPNDVHD